jgi:hypothetical protein
MTLERLPVGARDRLLGASGKQQRNDRADAQGPVAGDVARGRGAGGVDQQRLGVELVRVARLDDRSAKAREGVCRGIAGIGVAGDVAAVRQHRGAARRAEPRQRGGVSVAHAGWCDGGRHGPQATAGWRIMDPL